MTRASLIGLLWVTACASPSALPEAPTRQHAAVTLFYDSVAMASATTPFLSNATSGPPRQLGTSLSACPQGGFVAGAGTSEFVYFIGADYSVQVPWTGVSTTTNGLGRDVECLAANTWVAASPNGVYRTGSVTPLLPRSTWSLTRAGPALLAGALVEDTGCVFSLTDAGATQLLCGDGGSFGRAVAVDEDGRRLAVGSPDQDKVELFGLDGDGGLTLTNTLALPAGLLHGGGFGATLAWGDVAASPGKELLVGSADGVFIFDGAPQLVLSLELESRVDTNTLNGPPVSIAVLPAAQSTWPVRHFWLGFPSLALVFRCLGTLCDAFQVNDPDAPGSQLGAALAIDRTSLLVGAPAWANGGAVFAFTATIGPDFADGGFARACNDVNTPCACGFLCVGGVVCVPGDDSVCVADAGTDAGLTDDAGTTPKKDAGTAERTDAGVDGGTDAQGPGPAEFAARGCTSAPLFPLLLLGLLALRRGRHFSA